MCQSLFRPFLLGGPCTPQALAANIRAAGDFLKTGLDIDNLTYPYIESVELAARHTAPEPLRAWDAHMLREVKKHYDASLSQGEQEHECVCVSGEPALYSAPLALPQSGMSRQTQMPYLCLAWLWLGLVLRGGGVCALYVWLHAIGHIICGSVAHVSVLMLANTLKLYPQGTCLLHLEACFEDLPHQMR